MVLEVGGVARPAAVRVVFRMHGSNLLQTSVFV